MKMMSAMILSLAVAGVGAGQSASPQTTTNVQAPFTLGITGDLMPEHSMQWDFTSRSQTTRTVGAVIVIAVQKTNVSDHEITEKTKWGNYFGCQFDVRDSSGSLVKPLPLRNEGGSFAMQVGKAPTLHPGQSDVNSARLDELFDLSQPGRYTIQAWAHAWDDPKSPIVKSNTLTLIIEPAAAPPAQ